MLIPPFFNFLISPGLKTKKTKGQDTTHYLIPLYTLEIIAGDIFKSLAISDYLYPSSIAVIISLFLCGKS